MRERSSATRGAAREAPIPDIVRRCEVPGRRGAAPSEIDGDVAS